LDRIRESLILWFSGFILLGILLGSVFLPEPVISTHAVQNLLGVIDFLSRSLNQNQIPHKIREKVSGKYF
jgi:hypothetical protein